MLDSRGRKEQKDEAASFMKSGLTAIRTSTQKRN